MYVHTHTPPSTQFGIRKPVQWTAAQTEIAAKLNNAEMNNELVKEGKQRNCREKEKT